ncbi:MAG: hypothetical protein JNK48_06160 [Bryobacterales bacterium]|nr:hypothetical protein [Bryobacterales bacterium]
MAQLRSTSTGAKRAPSCAPPGELLEDRIRDGIAGSLNEQIAIGLQVGRALAGWHEKKRFLEHLSSSAVTIDADNNVTLFGPESNDTSLRYGNARAFGVILFELFSGRLMADHQEAEPDVELLHKAGLPPALVEVVSECVEDPGQGRVIEKSTRKLKEILRERLGERASTPKTLPMVGAALGLLALGCAVWLLLR